MHCASATWIQTFSKYANQDTVFGTGRKLQTPPTSPSACLRSLFEKVDFGWVAPNSVWVASNSVHVPVPVPHVLGHFCGGHGTVDYDHSTRLLRSDRASPVGHARGLQTEEQRTHETFGSLQVGPTQQLQNVSQKGNSFLPLAFYLYS